MLDFSDRTITGISILTSAADFCVVYDSIKLRSTLFDSLKLQLTNFSGHKIVKHSVGNEGKGHVFYLKYEQVIALLDPIFLSGRGMCILTIKTFSLSIAFVYTTRVFPQLG